MNPKVKVALLLSFFGLCGAAILATYYAREQTPPPAAKELYSVVSRQLSDLRAADFNSAYQHAAAGVQQKFSLPQFELMIRRNFSPMIRARHVEFGAMHIAGAAALVQVFLTAPDGAMRGFLYSFTAESGGWKIAGVQPLRAPPAQRLAGLHV